MNCFVLNLLLSSTHQITDTNFSVFGPVSLDIGGFHCEELSVKAGKEGHEEVLFAFNPKVVVSIVKSPGVGTSLTEHKEVFSTCDKAKSDQSSHENQGMPSSHTEVFVVRTDLFLAIKLMASFD